MTKHTVTRYYIVDQFPAGRYGSRNNYSNACVSSLGTVYQSIVDISTDALLRFNGRMFAYILQEREL